MLLVSVAMVNVAVVVVKTDCICDFDHDGMLGSCAADCRRNTASCCTAGRSRAAGSCDLITIVVAFLLLIAAELVGLTVGPRIEMYHGRHHSIHFDYFSAVVVKLVRVSDIEVGEEMRNIMCRPSSGCSRNLFDSLSRIWHNFLCNSSDAHPVA